MSEFKAQRQETEETLLGKGGTPRNFAESRERIGLVVERMRDRLSNNQDSVDEKEEDFEMEEKWVPNFGNTQMFINSFINRIPSGDQQQPSMILEVGGGKSARPYPQQVLSSKNLIVGNVDMCPEWGDRKQQCDLNSLTNGLNDPN